MIRAAGAREVHLRLGSPPITGPCHYGIDTPTREELIAATHSIEEIRQFLGVDSPGLPLARRHAARGRQGTPDSATPASRATYPTPDPGRPGAAPARLTADRHARMSGPYTQPLVYFFGQGRADGTAAMKDVLGGKGAGLAEMTTIGIPVPPGFTIASSLCLHYLESRQFPKRLQAQVENALQRLEAATGKHFGDGDNPLLVSRALRRRGLDAGDDGDDPQPRPQRRHGRGAHPAEPESRSSPGTPTAGSCRCTAASCSSCPRKPFEQMLEEHRQRCRVERDIDLPVEEMQALVRRFKEHVRQETGREFPDDPLDQLWGAIAAVFESWNTRRAIDYRKLHDIPDSHGHRGQHRGDGVRQPGRGFRHRRRVQPRSVDRRARLYGEFLLNAQGEDVVSGSRTPLPIATLKERLPACLPGAGAGGPHARAALPGRAGHGVHHRARQCSTCCRPGAASARATRRCGSPAR